MTLVEKIDAYHEENQRPARGYLGPSAIGEPCSRRLWYGLHENVSERFSGRMLRLFRRGNLEENTMISDLKAVGYTVNDEQKRLDFGHGFIGHIDGIVNGDTLLEMKTFNDKGFKELKKGVIPEKHMAQMQVYMLGLGVNQALYLAVNKNDDELFATEIIFNRGFAEDMVRKAHDIILADTPPKRLTENPDSFYCKFCPARKKCHNLLVTKASICSKILT